MFNNSTTYESLHQPMLITDEEIEARAEKCISLNETQNKISRHTSNQVPKKLKRHRRNKRRKHSTTQFSVHSVLERRRITKTIYHTRGQILKATRSCAIGDREAKQNEKHSLNKTQKKSFFISWHQFYSFQLQHNSR